MQLKQTEAALPAQDSKLNTDTGELRMLWGMERGQTQKLFEKKIKKARDWELKYTWNIK